jgi:acyl-CoA dehydrogenase
MSTLSEEGRMIGDVADRLLRDIAPDTDGGASWHLLVEAGLPLMMVAQDHGGFGLSAWDGCAIVKATGAFATPLPLAETIIANWLLSDSGLLPAAGTATLADGHVELRRRADGWHVEGTLRRVPWGGRAEVVAMARCDGHFRLVKLLGLAGERIAEGASIAGEPCDDVRVAMAIDDVFVGNRELDHDWLRRAGAVMRSVQMAGAIETILDMTVLHVKERVQFGRPIGGFQAVQHQVAIVAAETAAAAVAADMAVDALADGLEWRAIAAAKVRIGDAAGRIATIAHQLHGAIGFTEEFRLHRFVRRLWAWRAAFGNEASWALELGRDLSPSGGDGLWPALTDI